MKFLSKNNLIIAICIAATMIVGWYLIVWSDRSRFTIDDLIYPQGTHYSYSFNGIDQSTYTFTSPYPYDQVVTHYLDFLKKNDLHIVKKNSFDNHSIYTDMNRKSSVKQLFTDKVYIVEGIEFKIEKSSKKTTMVTMAFSHDGKLLATGSGIGVEGDLVRETHSIRIWNVPERRLVALYQLPHIQVIQRLQFSNDGHWIAGFSGDIGRPTGDVYLWQLPTQ